MMNAVSLPILARFRIHHYINHISYDIWTKQGQIGIDSCNRSGDDESDDDDEYDDDDEVENVM